MDLHIAGLTSGYAGSTVLNGIDLDVEAGRALAVLGRNGVGKSTLMMTIAGLVRPTGGSITAGGRELAGLRPNRIAKLGVGLVPQGRRLWGSVTVREHLDLAARQSRRHGDGAWSVDRVHEAFPRLAERASHLGSQLSGGEQQMVAISRALLTNPGLVILDEPSDGLAPALVQQIGDVLRDMARSGVTVVLVEQDLHLAFSVCDHVAVIEKGRVVHTSTTAEFRSDPATARRLIGVA